MLRTKLVRKLTRSWRSGAVTTQSRTLPPPSTCRGTVGELSLLKGVLWQGNAAKGAVNKEHRRVLKHMRFDKVSGNFVPIEKRKINHVMVSYEVDHSNHKALKEMLNHANGVSGDLSLELPTMTVADTGATVVCGETELMQGMGLKLNQLLPTNLTLFTADKKSLTVLGAVPVIISVKCGDGSTATTRDMLYIVEELTSVFVSRDALSNLGIVSKEFPKVATNVSRASAGWPGSRGSVRTPPSTSPASSRTILRGKQPTVVAR
jgi:hypothetical protein